MTEAEILARRVMELRANRNKAGIENSSKARPRVNLDSEVLFSRVKRPTFEPPPEPILPAEGIYHPNTQDLMAVISLRMNAMLVGPAGSSKTTAAIKAAETLGLPFYAPPLGPDTTASQLYGYRDAHGNVVRTQLREAWEHGGVCLFDEFDILPAPVAGCTNMITGNDRVGFPDGVIKKHADFVLIVTANTFGTGATRQYVGRQKLDAATLDRFVMMDWPYCEALEQAITINRFWTNYVQAARAAAQELGILHVISPRASINGGKLLACGFEPARVVKMVIWKGLDQVSIDKIEAKIGGFAMKDAAPTV